MTYVESTSTLKDDHVFSSDDCEGGCYLAETSGHSREKVNRIELRMRKETLISFTYYPSTYSECVIVRTICAYDESNYIYCVIDESFHSGTRSVFKFNYLW